MRNPLTLAAFADWAEKMPAGEVYDYCDESNCACAQYARSLGLIDQWMHSKPNSFWHVMDDYAFAGIDRTPTFGSLAARLRAAA